MSEPITEDVSPAAEPLGSGDENLGVLRGGRIVKVERPGAADVWVMAYQYPRGSGQFFAFQFESLDQINAVLGEDWWQKPEFQVTTRRESWLQSEDVDLVDSAAAVIGVPGTFNGLVQDIMLETATEMGVDDPGLLGRYLSNPEIQLALTKGALGGWSSERIQAEIRNTSYYRTELYPGIDKFFEVGSRDPEGDWARYNQAVESSLELLGVERDADGSYRQAVGQMLSDGISDDAFVGFAPTFKRAQDSPQFAEALNLWTERRLGKSLEFDEVFDLLAGESSPELAQVVEEANLQYAADQTGFEDRRGMIAKIARETDLSEAQIRANFDEAELSVLALGDRGLAASGLRTNDLINAAFGLTPQRGGVADTSEEITRRASKFARELGMLDDEKASLFVSFDAEGKPVRPGLQAFRPQGA